VALGIGDEGVDLDIFDLGLERGRLLLRSRSLTGAKRRTGGEHREPQESESSVHVRPSNQSYWHGRKEVRLD
jgi:hypothetical protein